MRHRVRDARDSVAELRRLASVSSEELSIDQVFSMRYNIIVLAESLASMAIHIPAEEQGYMAESYSEALERLARLLGLRPSCIEDLKALARLRNLLVHGYWVVDDRKIHGDVGRSLRCVEDLLGAVGERYG